jgi:hypothetical protein
MLPLSKLIQFMLSSFKCRGCSLHGGKRFTIERYGIALSFYVEHLNCGLHNSCHVDLSAIWKQNGQRSQLTKIPRMQAKIESILLTST